MRTRRTPASLIIVLLALLLALAWSAPAHAEESGSPGSGGENSGRSGGNDASGADEGSNAGAPPGISVPRVMLTRFTAKPASVEAGEKVTLSYTLKNMSNVTLVQNLRITISSDDAGAFLPVDGSASSYVTAIYAGGTTTGSIEMRTLPSLEQRPYALTLRVEYEDAKANPYQASEQVAIPVTQAVRVDTSSPQVMPAQITVGQQAAVTFSVNNLGRNKLFNVQATIPDGQSVAPQKAFIGTIEPGASGFVDLTVEATKSGKGSFTMEISYEDANGKVTTTEVPISLEIAAEPTAPVPPPIDDQTMGRAGGGGLGVIPVVAGVLAVALIATLVVLVVRRQRRRAAQRESELALLDGDPLLPADEG